ncbi:MAG: hypothetical protein LBF50_08295 [Azoarcus sp.]|nr:hypothetical protein [Azoarcus sp.]
MKKICAWFFSASSTRFFTLAVCGALLACTTQTTPLSERELAAKTLFDKGTVLLHSEPDAAIAIFDEVVSRFGEDASPGMRKQVAMALFSKGMTLGRQNKHDAAMAAHDELDRRFGQDASPDARKWVAMALFNKNATLRIQNKPDAAMAVHDELDRRFG